MDVRTDTMRSQQRCDRKAPHALVVLRRRGRFCVCVFTPYELETELALMLSDDALVATRASARGRSKVPDSSVPAPAAQVPELHVPESAKGGQIPVTSRTTSL